MGFQYNATAAIIPQWFAKKRSFATSLGSAGSGLGGLIYCLAAGSIIQSMGPGWAFRILAIVSAAANTVCAILLRDRNKEIGTTQIAFDWSLLRRWEYCLTVAWGVFSIISYIVLLFSLPAYARSIGLTAQQGSIVGAMLNFAQAIGRPIIGLSSDKFGRLNVALAGSFLPAIFIFAIWIPANSYGLLIFSSLILGLTIGTFWTTVAPVNAEVVGLEHLSSALSIFWPLLIIPTVFAEPIALELRKSTGNIYIYAQVFTGFMFIGATLCMWFVRVWKKEQLQNQKSQQEIRSDIDVLESQNNRNRTESRWTWTKL
jgi:MFS family permease